MTKVQIRKLAATVLGVESLEPKESMSDEKKRLVQALFSVGVDASELKLGKKTLWQMTAKQAQGAIVNAIEAAEADQEDEVEDEVETTETETETSGDTDGDDGDGDKGESAADKKKRLAAERKAKRDAAAKKKREAAAAKKKEREEKAAKKKAEQEKKKAEQEKMRKEREAKRKKIMDGRREIDEKIKDLQKQIADLRQERKDLGPLPGGGGGGAGSGRGRASVYSGKLIMAKHTDDEGNLVNPRREGTWGERSYNIILEAEDQTISYEDYKKAGGRNNDLKWDYDHGYVDIVDPEDDGGDGDADTDGDGDES